MADVLLGRLQTMTVHREGTRVQLIVNGTLALDVPWEAADEIAKALHVQARRAEEEAKAEQIIYDQAILTRLGVPVGLTDRPDMQREACKEAAWNSDLRRYVRPTRAKGIETQEVFGTPTVIGGEK